MSWPPGPWEVADDGFGVIAKLEGGPFVEIAKVNPFHELIPDVAQANATLIAAAPALYEALKLLVADVADYEAWQRPCRALDVAEAALRKAALSSSQPQGDDQ